MQQVSSSLFARPDTMLGVCEGLGQDLGISPTLLRIGFGVALLWNPLAVIAAYVATGIGLMLVHWALPVRHSDPVGNVQTDIDIATMHSDNDGASLPTQAAA